MQTIHGPVLIHAIDAPTMLEAHRALGVLVQEPARAAIQKRRAALAAPQLDRQLQAAVASLSFLRARVESPRLAAVLRRALEEYLECLDAWASAVGVGACLDDRLVDGRRVTPLELALWAQDDNAGCQTGMQRREDGSVLFWHTEEDTLGYFDLPRLVSFAIRGQVFYSFIYSYLLPGPAFGFRDGHMQAVDSLHVRRGAAARGSFTSTVAWLSWRLGPEVDAREVVRALSPCVDGCALSVALPTGREVIAMTHELGGPHLVSRRLVGRGGARLLQVNIVTRLEGPLGRAEALTARDRAKYERRIQRAEDLLDAMGKDPEPADILRMLASRDGGSYAFANADVKAHCVAVVSRHGIDVHVGGGSAQPGDEFQPQWRVP